MGRGGEGGRGNGLGSRLGRCRWPPVSEEWLVLTVKKRRGGERWGG